MGRWVIILFWAEVLSRKPWTFWASSEKVFPPRLFPGIVLPKSFPPMLCWPVLWKELQWRSATFTVVRLPKYMKDLPGGKRDQVSCPIRKNPIAAENLTGMARVLRSHLNMALENCVLWHERDISHSCSERLYLPDNFGLLVYGLRRLAHTLKNLVVDEAAISNRVKENFSYLLFLLPASPNPTFRPFTRAMLCHRTIGGLCGPFLYRFPATDSTSSESTKPHPSPVLPSFHSRTKETLP